MTDAAPLALIRRFIRLFSEQKWDEALALLADGFVAEWPQSRERIRGSLNYIDVNRHYPGNHRLTITRAHELGELVIATTWIEADTGQKTFVISYFTVREGRIASAEEYWAEPYPASEWRARWVERY